MHDDGTAPAARDGAAADVTAAASPRPADAVAGLLRAVAAGDQAALAQLVTDWSPRLRGFLLGVCGDRDVVEEVLAETFVAVWRSAGSFRGDSAGLTWLFAVAHRRLLARLRRHRLDVVELADDDAVVDTAPGPEALALSTLGVDRIRTAVAGLSEPHRHVLALVFGQHLTPAQAADVLGIPVGTVHSRMFNARRALAAALAHDQDPS